MDLVKPFHKISKHDVAKAGGKGASLGEMTQARIPVPPGFVVLADAFDQFITEANLHAEIETALGKVDNAAMHTVEAASENIQALVLNAPMPVDLENEILRDFAQLDCRYVAVRSSATAEDSSEAAWAG